MCSRQDERENVFACDGRDIGLASGGLGPPTDNGPYFTKYIACPKNVICSSCYGKSGSIAPDGAVIGGSTSGDAASAGENEGSGIFIPGVPGSSGSGGGSGGSIPVRNPPPPDQGCSASDASPSAILTCINAVRYDPFVMADVPCFSVVQTPATNLRRPQRWNLTINNALIDAAISHNGLQIEKEQIITNSMRIS
ncbi:hypothetical protein GPECTOR_5g239 [Gonium pectorale]|uniref:Uncharacterized protein n=1 Tax=Gonium pectorale TaxID=33097 RepID=A0A150GWG2_GONPE|nr:hypothetical protein GPECTOR_5g239 [Gonium pectorale]|eukprot:KXZ54139.1 hypothetical protein GPECTOR_5g239 [Gonium pectorale]